MGLGGWRRRRKEWATLILQKSWRQVLGLRDSKQVISAKRRREGAARQLLRRWRFRMLRRIRARMQGQEVTPDDAPAGLPGRPGEMIGAMQCLRRYNAALAYEVYALERGCCLLEEELDNLQSASLS